MLCCVSLYSQFGESCLTISAIFYSICKYWISYMFYSTCPFAHRCGTGHATATWHMHAHMWDHMRISVGKTWDTLTIPALRWLLTFYNWGAKLQQQPSKAEPQEVCGPQQNELVRVTAGYSMKWHGNCFMQTSSQANPVSFLHHEVR